MTRILVLLLGLVLVTLAGCSSSNDSAEAPEVAASGLFTGTFDSVSATDGFVVAISRGASSEVKTTVTGISEDDLEVTIADNRLVLGTKSGAVPAGAQLRADVIVPALVSMTVSTGAQVMLGEDMTLGNPDARVEATSGAGFTGEVSAKNLEIQMDAGSRLQLTGSARSASVVGSEAADLAGEGLVLAKAEVELSSAATAQLTVNGTLAASLSTGAKLTYGGDPKITQRDVKTGAKLAKAKG